MDQGRHESTVIILLIGILIIVGIIEYWAFNRQMSPTDEISGTRESEVQISNEVPNKPASSSKITIHVYHFYNDMYQESVRAIPYTSRVADTSLQLLFQEYLPEVKQQYRGVTIADGVATVDFSSGARKFLDAAPPGISAEYTNSIRKTLLQFPTVQRVNFSIDGALIANWDA